MAGAAPGHRGLAVGSGTGEPALSAARAIAPGGRVVGVDLSPAMVAAAARAAAAGTGNVEFVVGAVETAALPRRSFDVALSRWGLMFAADRVQLLRAVAGLLKPGAVLAAAVWTEPQRVPVISLAFRVISAHLDLGSPPPGPGPFTMTDPAAVAAELEHAGFDGVELHEHSVPFRLGSIDEFACFSRDVLHPACVWCSRSAAGPWTTPTSGPPSATRRASTRRPTARSRCRRTACASAPWPEARGEVRHQARAVRSARAFEHGRPDPAHPRRNDVRAGPAGATALLLRPHREAAWESLEECLATLEDARFASVYASGQAAATTVLSLLEPGQRVVACDDLYAGTHALFDRLGGAGVDVEDANLSDARGGRADAGTERDREPALVRIETPSNPLLWWWSTTRWRARRFSSRCAGRT